MQNCNEETVVKIDSKIVKVSVGEQIMAAVKDAVKERPNCLYGSTYKIKPPISEHAFYITINNTEDGDPFEIFINSKDMSHYQWIAALTRMISAIFRRGGDLRFVSEELQAIFDPRGGYFQKGGHFIPSLVAEIGQVIEKHMGVKHEQPQAIEQPQPDTPYPPGCTICPKCNQPALKKDGGCEDCLNCSYSKCA